MSTKKKCKKGYSCGKSCISVKKACKVSFSEGVSVNLETRSVELQSKPSKIKMSAKEISSKIWPLHPDKQQEFLDSLDKESIREWTSLEANERWAKPKPQQRKVESLLEKVPGLEPDEAMGIAAWISYFDYKDLNRVIYDPGFFSPAQKAVALYANEMIAEAVKKLPKVDRERMLKEYEELDDGEKVRTWAPPGEYTRGLSFPFREERDNFALNYIKNIGGVIKEQTHFAASGFEDHTFVEEAGVVFRVKAKDDGTGNAVTLDTYKGYTYEAEIFYAAGQNFKVLGAKETAYGYEIELEEV